MKRALCVLVSLGLMMSAAWAEEIPAATEPAALVQPVETESAPTEAPAAEETATPMPPEETPEASALPTAVPETPAPPAEETPTAAPSPEITPVPEESAVPELPVESASPAPSPEASIAPEPTMDPALIEGWILDADGEKLLPGRLEELLNLEGELTVAVSTGEQVMLEGFPTARLRDIRFLPDGDVFPGTDWRVVLSKSERLRDEYSQDEIADAQDGEAAPLYIWVREELPAPTEDPAELQLVVHAENLVTGEWSNVRPLFAMEGIGAGAENCDYAVIILDERIAMLSGSSYQPGEEGVYTVRLAIMNEMGDIVDRSEKYTLWLDWTAPELAIEVSMVSDRTMTISASDRVSGVAGISLDGGETWTEFADSLSYTAPEKQSFAPGMIRVRDNAGNIACNEMEITLEKLPSYGGGGSGTVSKQHSAGEGDTAEYASYALELPEGESTRLILGGEEVDLVLTSAEDGEEPLPFTAELACWARTGAQADKQLSPDTLVLRAAAGAEEGIIWHINGAVLRKLYNSDIAYLLLEQDGEMLSLPTIGFTAGTRYAELKMMGASTGEFAYEVHMHLLEEEKERCEAGFNQSRRLLPALWVEVEGERFEMGGREATPEMYFYDVYCASEDLPSYPYGAYPGTNPDEETEV